jgi:alpha/beta hydrolase family protein
MHLTRIRGEHRVRISVVALAALLISAFGCGDDDGSPPPATQRGAGVSRSHIEGPVTGGKGTPFIASTTFDLAQVGYSQAEYFLSGTATAYRDAGPFADDGKWTVTAGDTAAYKTRIVVYRPIDARKFNGTVVVEWLNVSGGLDAAPDWITGHTALIREGFAWVGVSAQVLGVEGGDSILGLPVMALKTTDPARYGTLTHPGDSFSYDIFSQAAQAIRRPAGVSPVGNLQVRAVIAAGESQSAFRLVTYIDAIHPRADIFDGFLVHSRGGGGAGIAPLSQSPQPAITVPGAAHIRDDLNVPVLVFETETDLSFLQYFFARQPDSDHFRLWEVAGTAHADTYTVSVGSTDLGNSPDAAKLIVTTTVVAGVTCTTPLNSGPQHFVLNAALVALNQWVRHGTLPPVAPRLDVNAAARIIRDPHGNALGGIRTPQVDVPIATLSGDGRGSVFCLLFGATTPFDAATLASLYPDHDAYVTAFDAATDRTLQAGFILPPDAALMKSAAAATDVGG